MGRNVPFCGRISSKKRRSEKKRKEMKRKENYGRIRRNGGDCG